mmetsp:Transcript_73314/g.238597  ORF Transcript_73314/g.238597 Transcript_73314/m.238597 type:complete len:114 (+) Transcript_73314:1455-1796(+)
MPRALRNAFGHRGRKRRWTIARKTSHVCIAAFDEEGMLDTLPPPSCAQQEYGQIQAATCPSLAPLAGGLISAAWTAHNRGRLLPRPTAVDDRTPACKDACDVSLVVLCIICGG